MRGRMEQSLTTPVPDQQAVLETRIAQLLAERDPRTTPAGDFLGAQFDAGLAFVQFPPGEGGLGFSRDLQGIVTERLNARGAPTGSIANPIGYGMAAPTIAAHASEELRRRYLRPLFTGEEIWCQLFSEPGAGSDLAAISTRARRDGDEWRLTGQKVWTSLAHEARWGLILARSDPGEVGHLGLTYFVLDMHAPGVDVRPLRQMTGDAEFNEVFLDNVKVDDHQRLGAVGDGWHVAVTTLMNERESVGSRVSPRGSGAIAVAVQLWHDRQDKPPVLRDRLSQLWIEAEVHRLTSIRASRSSATREPGPEGSTSKLHMTELNQKIAELCLKLIGPDGMAYDGYEMRRHVIHADSSVQRQFLRSRANTIEGGSSEIMRNILAERVLGLPKEPRSDHPSR
jgi:alkylation response protein AidB-like acyl-CoA dehydrogenase